jgi:hypothetical protein
MLLLVASLTAATAMVSDDVPPQTKPIGQLIWESHARGPQHPQMLPLPPVDPLLAAKEALTVETHGGRTPVAWVDVASPQRLLSLRTEGGPRAADLATEVLRVLALTGVDADAADIAARADAVPAELRAPFAALVATVADAYAEQALLAGSTQLSDAQRDATLARAEAIFAALNDLRAVAEDMSVPMTGAPVFSDPEGVIVLGGESDDTWTSGGAVLDPVLLVDLGGNDLYLNSAGGACGAAVFHACNMVPLSVVADLAGDDTYRHDGAPYAVQGAGSIGALGMLVDVEGDDTYFSKMTRTGSGPFTSYADGVAQGAANAGVGFLVDGSGNDLYQADVATTQARAIWNFAQGWGGYGGYAALADGAGSDTYVSNAFGETDGAKCPQGNPSRCAFIGVYTNGVGFYGGIGVQLDAGDAPDVYRAHAEAVTTDYYAQGFGAFAGVGILFEEGGDDDYAAGHSATNPYIQPLLNCAFGTGSLGGVGILLDLAGNDNYLGYSIAGSGKYAYTMNEGYGGPGAGYGLFVDVSGDDGHFMEAHGGTKSDTFGRGVLIERNNVGDISTNSAQGGNKFGNFLDLGGADVYTGAPPSGDGGVWSGGADLNLPPSVALAAVLG